MPAPNTQHESDEILPLAAPALVLGIILIGGGFAALLPARSWSHDYGSLLVAAAYAIYMSLAGSLSVWGLRLVRRQHTRSLCSDTDQKSTASSVTQRAQPSAETRPTFVPRRSDQTGKVTPVNSSETFHKRC
ncbi:hypothetical protein [Nocardia exalbida]|uniref:hypothetical protein n=1 Tax=Nocardia exalbida TaxID=290231 RepID=UPI0012F6A698|nr:hypothetical protein [Nocardia exalbida]